MVHIIVPGFIDLLSGNFYLCRTFTYFTNLPIPACVNHQSICIFEFDIFILDFLYFIYNSWTISFYKDLASCYVTVAFLISWRKRFILLILNYYPLRFINFSSSFIIIQLVDFFL